MGCLDAVRGARDEVWAGIADGRVREVFVGAGQRGHEGKLVGGAREREIFKYAGRRDLVYI